MERARAGGHGDSPRDAAELGKLAFKGGNFRAKNVPAAIEHLLEGTHEFRLDFARLLAERSVWHFQGCGGHGRYPFSEYRTAAQVRDGGVPPPNQIRWNVIPTRL